MRDQAAELMIVVARDRRRERRDILDAVELEDQFEELLALRRRRERRAQRGRLGHDALATERLTRGPFRLQDELVE